MQIGDSVKFYHKNTGSPVRDVNDQLLALPPTGSPMPAKVDAVRSGNGLTVIDLTGNDQSGQTFSEINVVVLAPKEMLPRGGRYALALDDKSVHPPSKGN